MDLIPIEI